MSRREFIHHKDMEPADLVKKLDRTPSDEFNYEHKFIEVLANTMAYVETGKLDSDQTFVFVHGAPESAYIWRNVIPRLESLGRCLAPDLVGMGDSGKTPDGSYRFSDHSGYLDQWFDDVIPEGQVTLVVHDWGSALGFHWARRNPDRTKGLAYMEAIVQPVTWDVRPEAARGVFQGFRSPAGEEMVLQKNVFVERVLPGSVLRGLTEDEMTRYREPYLEPGESRRPTLTWPREIPLDGEPADVHEIVADYASWLQETEIPKLFINAEPGAILIGPQRDFCRTFPNQQELTVAASHFVQEDVPDEIGSAIASWLPG